MTTPKHNSDNLSISRNMQLRSGRIATATRTQACKTAEGIPTFIAAAVPKKVVVKEIPAPIQESIVVPKLFNRGFHMKLRRRKTKISYAPERIHAVPTQKVTKPVPVPTSVECSPVAIQTFDIRRSAFCAKFKSLSKEHDLQLELLGNNKFPKFLCDIVYFSIIFELIHDNFDIISLPKFNPSGNFKSTTLEKIEYWHKEIPITIFKHLLANEGFETDKVRAAVAKTNTVIEAVAKQFESLNKA